MIQGRTLFFFLVVSSILASAYLVIKIAKGYKVDLSQKTFQPTGLLVATSIPDGAQIYVNDELKSATNTTLSLSPGEYRVEIKKDGYYSWKKTLQIKKELVTKTEAYLFPLVPDLKSLTFTGAQNPVVSPDETKVVYGVATAETGKNGLWVFDLSELPFGISREPRQIIRSALKGRDFANAVYQWSPDSKQILTTLRSSKEENFLLDPNILNSSTYLVDVRENMEMILLQWAKERKTRQEQKLRKLPLQMREIIKNKTADFSFSPDETKILYTATNSAQVPDNLINPVPGASTQPQERTVKPYQTYVYDIKEDRNFFITKAPEPPQPTDKKRRVPTPTPPPLEYTLSWFPTSRHLILVEKNKATVMEYDGGNKVLVYGGPFEGLSAFPFPSGNKLLVLASISSDLKTSPNLYAVSLR